MMKMKKKNLKNKLDTFVEFMETDWTKSKKHVKLNNMPFFNQYKKSKEGRIENPPIRKTRKVAFGSKRSPRPDPQGYRNPPNRRTPNPED